MAARMKKVQSSDDLPRSPTVVPQRSAARPVHTQSKQPASPPKLTAVQEALVQEVADIHTNRKRHTDSELMRIFIACTNNGLSSVCCKLLDAVRQRGLVKRADAAFRAAFLSVLEAHLECEACPRMLGKLLNSLTNEASPSEALTLLRTILREKGKVCSMDAELGWAVDLFEEKYPGILEKEKILQGYELQPELFPVLLTRINMACKISGDWVMGNASNSAIAQMEAIALL